MEKYAWTAVIREGKKEEYKRRHDAIWQEMKDVLSQAGMRNYTIWANGNVLFGYYECQKGVGYASKIQAESIVVKKWNEYMKDVLDMPLDPETGAQPHLEKMFEF